MSTSDFYIYTSLDKSYSDMHTVPSSSSYTTITITCDASSYYKICSSNSNVYIKSLTLSYNNTTNYDSSTLTYSDYRINMSDFYDTYTPTNGTIRTIPSDITVNSDGTYTVNEYKTYTYASYSYAISQSNPDLYAYTDPVDVANYYMLFHTWPVNYVDKKKVNSAKDYFTSSNVRCVSEYSRTNGYATAVPYYYNSGFVYYELDLDLYGTYSTSSRGVGRLVVWKLGFDATNYDSNPVIVYTDDHYATFKEYLNYGQFGTRFNAETSPTSYSWCNNVTLVK